MDPTIRRLTAETLSPAVEVLTAAFFDDPGFRFLVPSQDHRRGWLPVVFTEALRLTMPDGYTYTAADETGSASGVIAATPPGKYPYPIRANFRLFWRSFWKPRPWIPSLRALWPITRYFKACEQMHPKNPHWYVYIIGVHPENQGQGIGRRLMQLILDQADRDGLPIYLETETEPNIRFYRSLGFDITETRHPTQNGPATSGMIRAAGPAPTP